MQLGTKSTSFPITVSKTVDNEHLLNRRILYKSVNRNPNYNVIFISLCIHIHFIFHVGCGQPDYLVTFEVFYVCVYVWQAELVERVDHLRQLLSSFWITASNTTS